MRRLFNLFISPVPQFSSDQEIQDEQFLDKDGRVHMDTYLSFYDRETSVEAAVNETAFADNFIASFYSAPVSTDERHWEQAHGPETFVIDAGDVGKDGGNDCEGAQKQDVGIFL